MKKFIIILAMLMTACVSAFAEEKVYTKSYVPVYYELIDYESSNAEDIMGYASELDWQDWQISQIKKISNTQLEAINAIMSCYNYTSDEYYMFGFETQETYYLVEARIDKNKKVWVILYKFEEAEN